MEWHTQIRWENKRVLYRQSMVVLHASRKHWTYSSCTGGNINIVLHNTFSCEKPPICSIQRYDILGENRLEKVPVACFHFIRFVVHAHTRSYSARCISVVCACMSAIVCVFAWLVFPTAGYRQDKYRATELVRNCNHIFSVVFGRNATHHTNGVSIQFVHRIANTAFSDRNRRILCIRWISNEFSILRERYDYSSILLRQIHFWFGNFRSQQNIACLCWKLRCQRTIQCTIRIVYD